MFDWNDEELANIIWGEASEADDHIVPYPEGNEDTPPCLFGHHINKEWNQESRNAKPAEQTKPVTRNEYPGGKEESAPQHDTGEQSSAVGYSMDSWPDLPSSRAAKSDQDSMGTGVSKNLTVITKFDTSGRDEASQPEDGSKIFWDQHEDREQRDFVDCDWDNIGSFDDLDRIFSNDDAIFGHASIGNADQLWSSSKEATSAAEKSFPLSTNSPRFGLGTLRSQSGCNEVKTEYVQEKDQSFHQGFGGTSYHTTYAQQNVHRSADQVNYAGGQTGPAAKEKTELEMHGKSLGFNSHLAAENITRPNDFRDKVGNQKRISKTRKRSGGREGHLLQDSSNIWSPHGNQLQQYDQIPPSVPHIGTASILSQQTQPQGPACSQYQQSSNSFVAPSMFGSIKNQYSTMTSSPKNYFMKDDQSVLSDYECSPNTTSALSGFPGTSTNPLRMTPQEKIEKLRKRQQMRALLAIQKQQQKFRHRVSTNDYSVAQNCLRKNQIELMHGGNTEAEENVSTLLPIDPISPIEQDDSNTIPMAVDDYYSMEDTILHQLQDAIAKLDVRIRLCIRDSLSRLSKSAMRKHYANDTRNTNKTSRDEVEVITKEETSSRNRVTPIPDVETQTNPIDRAVAHLLFHRSFESSVKHPETPESPASTKLPLQCSPRGFVPDNYRSEQKVSYHDPHSVAEGDQSRSPCIDTSENASNNEESDGGGMEIDASQ